MSTQKKRSYTELINRLRKTLNNTVQILTLDHIKYSNHKYPFQKMSQPKKFYFIWRKKTSSLDKENRIGTYQS